MVSNNDILQLTLEGVYDNPGNQIRNVFQYEVHIDAPFSLLLYGQELIDEWFADFTPFMQDITNVIVGYQSMSVVNLSDPLQIYEAPFTVQANGGVTGDCLPPYASWAFQLRRTTAATRNGAKRFAGVSESQQINGEPTAGAALSLQSMASWLGNPSTLTLDNGVEIDVEIQPVICRKDNTGALIASQFVSSAQPRGVSTQNTRKFGRGI